MVRQAVGCHPVEAALVLPGERRAVGQLKAVQAAAQAVHAFHQQSVDDCGHSRACDLPGSAIPLWLRHTHPMIIRCPIAIIRWQPHCRSLRHSLQMVHAAKWRPVEAKFERRRRCCGLLCAPRQPHHAAAASPRRRLLRRHGRRSPAPLLLPLLQHPQADLPHVSHCSRVKQAAHCMPRGGDGASLSQQTLGRKPPNERQHTFYRQSWPGGKRQAGAGLIPPPRLCQGHRCTPTAVCTVPRQRQHVAPLAMLHAALPTVLQAACCAAAGAACSTGAVELTEALT